MSSQDIRQKIYPNGNGQITGQDLQDVLLQMQEDIERSLSTVGPQGNDGRDGLQGRQGPIGERGLTGERGPKGEDGDNGVPGAEGPRGYQGGDGAQGRQGIGGAQGFQGAQGRQGSQGFQGRQGLQGVQGSQGYQGAQGAQGSQGYQGAQGAQGVEGNQGTQGNQGAQGAQGAQGNQGCQGFQGVQGFQGKSGHTPMITTEMGENGQYYWKIDGVLTEYKSMGPQGPKGEDGKDAEYDSDAISELQTTIGNMQVIIDNLRAQLDEINNYVDVSFVVKSASDSYKAKIYYEEISGKQSPEHTTTKTIYSEISKLEAIERGTIDKYFTYICGTNPPSGFIIVNNRDIYDFSNEIPTTIHVLKGKTLNIQVIADGYLPYQNIYYARNSFTESIMLNVSNNVYGELAIITTEENAEIEIKGQGYWSNTNIIGYPFRDIECKISKDNNFLLYKEITKAEDPRQNKPIGRHVIKRYVKKEIYLEGDTEPTEYPYCLDVDDCYGSAFLKIEIENGMNREEPVQIYIPTGPNNGLYDDAVYMIQRYIHDTESNKYTPPTTVAVYATEKVSWGCHVPYRDGGPNFYPIYKSFTGCSSDIYAHFSTPYPYSRIKIPVITLYDTSGVNEIPIKVFDVHNSINYSKEKATNGEYVEVSPMYSPIADSPTQDGYLNIVAEQGNTSEIMLYAEGYIPFYDEYVFPQSGKTEREVINMEADNGSSYLKTYVNKIEKNYEKILGSPYYSKDESYNYDGYQALYSDDVYLYRFWNGNNRTSTSTVYFTILSKTKVSIEWSTRTGYSFEKPYYTIGGELNETKQTGDGFYYGRRIAINIIRTDEDADASCGTVTFTNEDGLTKTYRLIFTPYSQE